MVGFSATLKPFDYYVRLCGLDAEKVRTAEFASPFPAERRKILIIPQISTYYSRRERNYAKIAFAVQGGSFAEGIDYAGETVIGAFVVGPPLPSYDLEREEMKSYYQQRCGAGAMPADWFASDAKELVSRRILTEVAEFWARQFLRRSVGVSASPSLEDLPPATKIFIRTNRLEFLFFRGSEPRGPACVYE